MRPVVPERLDRRERDQLDDRDVRELLNSASYSPGQVISNGTLPKGVSETNLGLPVISPVLTSLNTVGTALINTGPIVGLTASNRDYGFQIFSVFTDFGTPAGGGTPARPGFSGVQGSSGGLLIGNSTALVPSAHGYATRGLLVVPPLL